LLPSRPNVRWAVVLACAVTFGVACTGNVGGSGVGPSRDESTGAADASRDVRRDAGLIDTISDKALGNPTAGTASFWYDGAKKITNFYAGVQLSSYTTTRMYTDRTCVVRGDEARVTNSASGLPAIEQTFVLNGGNKFLAQATVTGSPVATNWIAPVVVDTPGGVDIGGAGDMRVLWVPYDNDEWVSYNALPIANNGTSFEVAAFYDNDSRNGIVVGSVSHDTWKTGVYYAGANGKLDALNVFGGAVHATWTHDTMPHGKIGGASIASPLVFVGYAPDWRDLLEEYADANLAVRPRLPWTGDVPFGWNSWGKLQATVTFEKAIGASDFLHSALVPASFSNGGVVYVNLDSFWDNLSREQLDAFVARCQANGQKPGIYWTPFVDWAKSATRQVEGTAYTYADIWLKDAAGKPIERTGAYAIDPTHPGTKGRIDTYIDEFKSRGFAYLKLDFLTHGALESAGHYDPNVSTGTQAFNQGMQHLVDRVGGAMFISASIAPLFPYGYAHSRRVACDTFGAAVGPLSTHYQMNSASYGWWMSGRLYRFNDPDAMVFEGFTPNDNMTRLISGAVSGTIFLNGDDLTSGAAQALARTHLTNERINAVARLGKAFRPVEGNTGTSPSDWLVLREGGAHYLAVFNFEASTTKALSLARAGLDPAKAYTVTDLWTGAQSTASGTLSVPVDSGFARLFMLR
jgi:hypothetical protein